MILLISILISFVVAIKSWFVQVDHLKRANAKRYYYCVVAIGWVLHSADGGVEVVLVDNAIFLLVVGVVWFKP